ncbi:hypothetical protein [Archangium violaceum]|uniref:Lipoprotein n=1 Tax=Archangium violaceum Cb vi76 TaxID=1406225 RepID=A0A084SF23_9BACT|nr:hypothetical protein [Archangium violaceum]KFA87058.1 hypothetical protein Q664_50175 [Archangium violaceum Cb vi76]
MSRLLLLSGFMLLGAGCAGSHSHFRTGGPAYPLGQPAGEPMLVQGSYVTGPASSLVIDDQSIRGRFRDRPVSLSWTWQEVTGSVDARGTFLELAEGDDTRVWGSFGGMPVDLTLDKEWLYGNVGGCGYVLRRAEDGFVGRRSCGGSLEGDLRVDFPEPLLERPLGERASLMTLMLVNFTSTYSPVMSLARFARPRNASVDGSVTHVSP